MMLLILNSEREMLSYNVLLSSFGNFLLKSCSFNLSKVLLLIEGTMIKVLNISHSWRNLENLENIKMCSSFEAPGVQNQTSQSSLKDRYFVNAVWNEMRPRRYQGAQEGGEGWSQRCTLYYCQAHGQQLKIKSKTRCLCKINLFFALSKL